MYSNSFTKEEQIFAGEAFAAWQSKTYESVDEYILRQRKCELNALVNKVIEAELSPSDKMLVDLHWFQGLSKSEIARKLSLEPSTVGRRLNKISDIIYDKLKYALEFRYGSPYTRKIKLVLKSKDAFFTYSEPEALAARIKQLRMKQGFSVTDVSEMTGISEKNLKEIEEKGRELSATEIKKLSVFFNTTADYIIFGSRLPLQRKGS